MTLALFGIYRWNKEDYKDKIKENGYAWTGWTYSISKEKQKEFQHKIFNLYCYNPDYNDYDISPDELLKLTCNRLLYDVNGLEFPDKNLSTAFGEDDLEEPGWTEQKWRCWVRIINAEIIKKPLNELQKASDGKPPHPQGNQNRFSYLIDPQEGEIGSIPIMIDDIKRYPDFYMTRCTFFTIECDMPSPNWSLELENLDVPFYMLGLSGIIWKPIGDNETFNSPDSVDKLFNTIESREGLFVDVNDIWLPNHLFNTEAQIGDVYRINGGLFTKAYSFRENRISEKEFSSFCDETKQKMYFSKNETQTFKKWASRQIDNAIERYPKNKELMLEWREEKDNYKG